MRTLGALLFLLGAAACAEDENACEAVICADWQTCAAGACGAAPGRCDTYLDCEADERCDEQHLCVGPVLPAADFFDGEGDRLRFSVRGRIQAYEDVLANNISPADSTLSISVGAVVDDLVNYPYVGRLVVPATYPEGLAGEEAIVIGASHRLDDGARSFTYRSASLLLRVADLLAIRALGVGAAVPLPTPAGAAVREVTVTFREWDGSDLRRICPLAKLGDSGALFLTSYANETFAVGEELQLWGNVALTASPVITAENEESLCTYTHNGAAVTRAEYVEAVATTELPLSCPVPDDLLTPPGTSFVSWRFAGPINDPTVGIVNWSFGLGEIRVTLDGAPRSVDDTYRAAYRYRNGGDDFVVVQSLGGGAPVAPSTFDYALFYVVIDTATLVALHDAGGTVLPYHDATKISAVLSEIQQKIRGDGEWIRDCPVASSDNSPVDEEAVVACVAGNTSFAPGESFESAGLLSLSAYDVPCTCTHNGVAVGCATYEAQ